MPEKKHGMLDILKGVFKSRRGCCDDIVHQAEKVISDYVSRRRNEIINKYKKKNRALNAIIILASGALIYLTYWFIAG